MSSLENELIVRHSRGTAAAWTSADTVLEAGEWGYETDTNKTKIGDGSTAWTSLLYSTDPTAPFDSGWIANSDWTNAQLAANHALATNLSHLIVKFLISSDGTDANSYEVNQVVRIIDTGSATNLTAGYKVRQIDSNNIRVQTGVDGLYTLDDSGANQIVTTGAFYYKIIVAKLSVQQ